MAAPLLSAGRLLAERGGYGLVWIDPDLHVRARYGRLVDFVEIARPVTETLLPLIGLEGEIHALRDNPDGVVELPAVAIHLPGHELPRLNLTVLWGGPDDGYLLLVARAITRANLEAELSVHMRARLIAESELKAKSRELAQTNAELALANRDLEDFAAIISHDLQSPLRAMRYLAEDADSALRTGRVSDASARLAEIAVQGQRMSRMLRELLDYASVGRKEEVISEIDTRQLVGDVVRALARPRRMRVEVRGRWPRIISARAALDLALRNLLANAVKHHDRPQGLIRVTGRDAGDSIAITVADDGPGIDPRHHEVILLPFRTVSAQGEAGSGMGLAFVKRAVEALGGRLDLVSDPARARGAAFTLTIPKRFAA